MKGGKEAILAAGTFVLVTQIALDSLKGKDYFSLLSKIFQLYHQLTGMSHIDDKDTKEHSDEKRKCQIFGQPLKPFQNVGVNTEIVDGTQSGPCQRERGADDPLDVPPAVGIIP